jgi:predicted phosphoribosyltransferase
MYFLDRLSLGAKLADGITSVRGTDAIIVCLKDSSILTCISMATRLRAWIFPLEFEIVDNPMNRGHTLGAVTIEGEFIQHPDISHFEYDEVEMEFGAQLEDMKREAMSALNRRATKATLDKHIMNGRTIILAGDILFDALGLAVAESIMKPIRPKEIIGVAGNVTADISDKFHLTTNSIEILDILPTSLYDDDHYFEKPDAYSMDEKWSLAKNICNYWA